MRQGTYGNLNKLAQEISRQAETKKDIIAFSPYMELVSNIDQSRMFLSGSGQVLDNTEFATKQLAVRMGIPSSYYKTLRELSPELLDRNVNHWLQEKSKNLMVRTLDGQARAFLSDRYKRVDNYPVMSMVLEGVQSHNGIEIASCDVTDNRMYLKMKSPKLQGDVSVGDPIQMGITISNSEIGNGALEIKPMIYRLVCDNGMVSSSDYGESLRRTHLGARQGLGVLYEEDTVMIEGQAMALKVRDTIAQILNPETFQTHLQMFKDAKEQKVTGDPTTAIKVLGNTIGFNQEEGSGIMRHLIEGGDLSKYGLLNATTAYAQAEHLSYDRASEFEIMGGKILSLSKKQWKAVSEAA